MKTGIELIAQERQQLIENGGTPEHDDLHLNRELALAGAAYAVAEDTRDTYKELNVRPAWWPWDDDSWKPTPGDPVRELAKAGALIAAEIDRLQRTNTP